MNNDKSSAVRQALLLALGELLVLGIVVGVYLIIDKFTYSVLLGAALGALVGIFNFFFLTVSVNRAVDEYLRLRGEREMSEEELERFTAEHSARVQNAAKVSYIVRTVAMLGALVLAFALSTHFDVLATAIPLLMYRPLMYFVEIFERKKGD
ncbi:MAG: hypothetical protein IKA64_05010 [Clostridia bacterium]|nr:hypothetical protein [Clostridia bacterium]